MSIITLLLSLYFVLQTLAIVLIGGAWIYERYGRHRQESVPARHPNMGGPPIQRMAEIHAFPPKGNTSRSTRAISTDGADTEADTPAGGTVIAFARRKRA